ncbi:putative neprosin [Helianthus anomalus]
MLQHAIGFVRNEEFYGAKAVLNVWKPDVIGNDFSLSQIWVLSNFPGRPANSIEAGWQVSSSLALLFIYYSDLFCYIQKYIFVLNLFIFIKISLKNNNNIYSMPSKHKDGLPRLFTYWTPNGYRSGCYNMICPGFVQTSRTVSLGAAIGPISTYNGEQFDVAFMIWKDPKSENWWLKVGNEVIGYWPASLFTDLRNHATLIEYGGEVYSGSSGKHTSTQMGSGHFPYEGLGKAAYARNLEVIDRANNLNAASNLQLFTDKPNCYDVTKGYSDVWHNYIYFGGPGYNPKCP